MHKPEQVPNSKKHRHFYKFKKKKPNGNFRVEKEDTCGGRLRMEAL
jgi:hypothetical protein